MGQKAHPIGVRLGIIKGWESNWYGGKNFADKLVEDEEIRSYLLHRKYQGDRQSKAGISKIVIERTLKRIIITIHTARPGIIIGQAGQNVEKLKEELSRLYDKDVQINIHEIRKPELDAKLVADNIAAQLQARVSFRRAMKMAIDAAMSDKGGAEGIKIICSGRLGGAEMARSERYQRGRIPLQTLRADIDYATATAHTIYGSIGVKVWIYKGDILKKVDLAPDSTAQKGKRTITLEAPTNVSQPQR
ncbi:MAG: 30S ribosomal protein S3, partial [Bacteroidia bacterium]|nr:30S ribosomal protein S3 [Bacteroidia bacterium]MDW8159599.1 30S ribosomal protein S3 [Bacteroidia bacterium]